MDTCAEKGIVSGSLDKMAVVSRSSLAPRVYISGTPQWWIVFPILGVVLSLIGLGIRASRRKQARVDAEAEARHNQRVDHTEMRDIETGIVGVRGERGLSTDAHGETGSAKTLVPRHSELDTTPPRPRELEATAAKRSELPA